MNRILIKTFVALALLLSISEVASGGTVRFDMLLNGAPSDVLLGEVTQDIDQSSGLCILTVSPALAYSVESVTARKVVDAGYAQSRRKAPTVSVPIEVSAGDVENTWLFSMPPDDYDIEVMVNFKIRKFGLAVKGIEVTAVNRDNILGDANATVRFNPISNTLTLYGANIETTDTTAMVRSSLPVLTVDLRGNNRLKFVKGFVSELTTGMASLNFTTKEETLGQLSWETFTDGGVAPFFASGFNVNCEAPLRDFSVCEAERLISKEIIITYDLLVGSTPVTSKNCTDILGDGGTVKYAETDHTLVLEGATLFGTSVTSSLAEGLTIYLLGENVISGSGNLIVSTVNNAPLEFTTSDTRPGMLKLIKTEVTGIWMSGFGNPVVPEGYATTTDVYEMTVSRIVRIAPIVQETENGEQPKIEEPTDGFGQEATGEDPDTYLNVVVNNVLYTLKASDYSEGDDENPDDPSGVNLTEVPDNMDDVLNEIPGTPDYADAFKGLTIEVPAGNGQVMVTGEIGTGAKLAVKIGNNDPVLFPNDDFPAVNELETISIPYSCSENTFVYIYLASAVPDGSPSRQAAARAMSPFRGRVLTGHVKITSVGGSSSLVVSNNAYSSQTNTFSNRVIAYNVPASAKTADNHGIVMSTVAVQTPAALARGTRREAAEEQKKITELGSSVFDNVDKDEILYIDLSGTDIKDMTVNRIGGLFAGFGQNTLIYLPAANDDGGEDNVILEDNCARVNLVDDMDFRAPKSFTADNAALVRTFTVGETSTAFLPFALSKEQADAVGSFHTFKKVDGANAVFNEAETSGTMANTPYVFVPVATKIAAQNVSVEGYMDSFAASGNLIGTYEKLLWDTDKTDIYGFTATGLGEVATGRFVRVAAGEWLSPFSAYMKVSNNPNSSLNLVIGDNPTSHITEVNASSTINDSWYTISGQRLAHKPSLKGFYINNRKIIILNSKF